MAGLVVGLALALAACDGGDERAGEGDRGGGTGSSDRSAAPDSSGPLHRFVPLDAGGSLTKDALIKGEIDVAVLFTSSAGEHANGWVHLVDDRGLQPAENFVPAVNADALDHGLASVLERVSRALTEARVQEMMDRILVDGQAVGLVAQDFLATLGRIPGVTGRYTVGRAEFIESELAAEIYAAALEEAGADVERTPALGFREVYFPALEAGDVDVMPEFVGSLLAYLGGRPTSELAPTLERLRELADRRGVAILDPAPAESKDGFYATRRTARSHDLETVSDLAEVPTPLIFGGPAECPQREFCLIGLQEVYGLRFET